MKDGERVNKLIEEIQRAGEGKWERKTNMERKRRTCLEIRHHEKRPVPPEYHAGLFTVGQERRIIKLIDQDSQCCGSVSEQIAQNLYCASRCGTDSAVEEME